MEEPGRFGPGLSASPHMVEAGTSPALGDWQGIVGAWPTTLLNEVWALNTGLQPLLHSHTLPQFMAIRNSLNGN